MIQVILVIHLILAVSIIGLILVQRSEGGGIGLGTGGGLGSFATPQATASVLNKVTWYCAAGFFTTSLVLGILYNQASSRRSILDQLDSAAPAAVTAPVVAGSDTKDAKDEPIVPDTAPPATKTKAVKKSSAKSETKKSEPSVPVTP